ncbi:FG-GAP repeat protein, partial [Candidatus Uhrbacteria bacterium]|nr:FG-GAP repeat protein [Candidatus Uhrbacteria bacterium]
APSSDDAATDAGSVYVLFGSLSSGDISLTDANAILLGEAEGDNAGWSVAGIDLDDDDYTDLVCGAYGHKYELEETVEAEDAGSVYLFYGSGY